jgi:hypothetical protein
MALKYVVTKKEELDQLAEPVRQLYIEKDGRWTLAVDGVVLEADLNDVKTKLGEFRDNNRTMHNELEKLRPLEAKFKDVDPEEYKRLKTEAKKLEDKGIKSTDDLQAAIAAALKPVTERLDASEKARVAAQQAVDRSTFEKLIAADATKAGVKPQSLRHVLREADDVFVLKDGKVIPKDGVKHPTDPSKDMTTDAWLLNLATTDDYLFGESSGGGANNSTRPGGGRPGAKILRNPSPEEMGRNMDAIAKGEMVVVRD